MRLLTVSLIALVVAVLLAVPALAQTAELLPPICAELDQWLTDNLAEIAQRQQQYQNLNGRYWQGLATHSTEPVYQVGQTMEDVLAVPDRLDARPSDQAEDWLAIFPEFSTERLPAQVTVDVYDGPQGQGYTIRLLILYTDLTYERVIQFGPERWREHDWRLIEEPQP